MDDDCRYPYDWKPPYVQISSGVEGMLPYGESPNTIGQAKAVLAVQWHPRWVMLKDFKLGISVFSFAFIMSDPSCFSTRRFSQ